MTSEDNVVDLTEYLKLKKNLEQQGRPLDKDAQAQLNQRIIRIRESIARIDKLMRELRNGEPNDYSKKGTDNAK
jgi:hypothetical protein